MERRAEPGSAALQHPLATKSNVCPSPLTSGCGSPLCCEAHFPYWKGKKAFVVWSSGDVSPAHVLPCQSLRQPETHRDPGLRLREGTGGSWCQELCAKELCSGFFLGLEAGEQSSRAAGSHRTHRLLLSHSLKPLR